MLDVWLPRGGFLPHEEALPFVDEDALGGADMIGASGMVCGQADDGGGVGEGDPLGEGGPADQRRATPAGGYPAEVMSHPTCGDGGRVAAQQGREALARVPGRSAGRL